MIWKNWAEPLPEHFHELLEFGILASKKEPFDPMEKALRQMATLPGANGALTRQLDA